MSTGSIPVALTKSCQMSADVVFNPTMTGIWQVLARTLLEAPDAITALLNYVERRHGEHRRDELAAFIQKNPLNKVKDHVAIEFMDAQADRLAKAITLYGGPKQQEPARASNKSGPQAGTTNSQDKGSTGAEPIPKRPDRMGTQARGADQLTTPSRGGPPQGVGTAGQNQPKVQPSTVAAKWVKGEPVAPPPVPTKVKSGQSTVAQNQKDVDYYTKTYGAEVGDAEADKVGVPRTSDRTRLDKDGNQKVIRLSPDAIRRLMDPDLNPNAGKGGGVHQAQQSRAVHKPPFKGSQVGQRWSPAGTSQLKTTSSPNAATGQMQGGSYYTNPAGKGQEVVWDGQDWVLPSQFAATVGDRVKGLDRTTPDLSKHRAVSPVNPPRRK